MGIVKEDTTSNLPTTWLRKYWFEIDYGKETKYYFRVRE